MKSTFPCCLALALISTSASAEQAPGSSPSEAIERAASLRAAGDSRDAIDLLKESMAAFPDHERVRHALSLAYLEANNEFWALKVLREFEEDHPPACNTRAFEAWIHIKQANLDLADEILDAPGCASPDYVAARFALLKTLVASQREDTKAVQTHLATAQKADRFYEEDKALLDAFVQRHDPGRLPVTSWRVDLAAGWTSNGLAGSPQDPADVGENTASALLQFDARLRVVVPASRSVRPVIEGQVRALELASESVQFLGYRQPSLRPGVLLGDTMPRLLLTYGLDAVQIVGGDRYEQGPLWYSEGHRFDYELEATEYLLAFGGGGHRTYREAGRTRWEAEQGLALGLPIGERVRLMAGASVRWFRAENEAYDTDGATLLSQLQVHLPARLEGRLNASVSYDDYPRSQGYFPGSQGEARTDLQVRVKPGLWSPSWSGFRIGLDYEYSHRSSTATSYEFGDNRVLLHGVWVMDGDRFGTTLLPKDGREPMPHAVSGSGLLGDDMRIRDLMQQDEAVKRGSSCLN